MHLADWPRPCAAEADMVGMDSLDKRWDESCPAKATCPKPNFVIGFEIIADTTESPSPLNAGMLSVLSAEPDFDLQPCTRADGTGVGFPALVHESKRASGAPFEAANQLARSFVWMLNQQDELRRAALKGDANANQDRLPVFGIAAVGSFVEVYSAIGTFTSGFVSQFALDSIGPNDDTALVQLAHRRGSKSQARNHSTHFDLRSFYRFGPQVDQGSLSPSN